LKREKENARRIIRIKANAIPGMPANSLHCGEAFRGNFLAF
jgi:hypothetical protein